MAFKPAFENHSIEVCELAVAVVPAFDASDLRLLQRVCTTWSDELPAMQVISSEAAQEESLVALAPPRHNQGLKYAYYRPNGAPVWELVIANNEIRLACTRYLNWTSTWEFAEEVFSTLLEALAKRRSDANQSEPELQIAIVGLRFEDRFISEKAPHDFGTLFEKDTKYLPTIASDWDEVWNVHTGWFSEDKSSEALNSLQIAASLEGDGDENSLIVVLNHMAQARLKVDGRPQIVEYSTDTLARAFSTIKDLHAKNKQLISDLLNKETLISIGLDDAG